MPSWTGPTGALWNIQSEAALISAMEVELSRLDPSHERYPFLSQRLEYEQTGSITPTNWRNDQYSYYHVKGYIDPTMLATIYEDLNDYILTGDARLTETQLNDIYHGRISNPYIAPSVVEGSDLPIWNPELEQWWVRDDYYWDPEFQKWIRYYPDDTIHIEKWEETPDFDAYIEPDYTTDWGNTIWPSVGAPFRYVWDNLTGGWGWLKEYGPIILIVIAAIIFLFLFRRK